MNHITQLEYELDNKKLNNRLLSIENLIESVSNKFGKDSKLLRTIKKTVRDLKKQVDSLQDSSSYKQTIQRINEQINKLVDSINKIVSELDQKQDKGNYVTEDELLQYATLEDVANNYQEKGDYATNSEISNLVKDIQKVNNNVIFKDKSGNIIYTLETSEFLKDGMLENAVLDGNVLKLTFNTDSGKEEISIDLEKFFDEGKYYTKQESDQKYQVAGNYLTTDDIIVVKATKNGQVYDLDKTYTYIRIQAIEGKTVFIDVVDTGFYKRYVLVDFSMSPQSDLIAYSFDKIEFPVSEAFIYINYMKIASNSTATINTIMIPKSITIDSQFSDASVNPVTNSLITNKFSQINSQLETVEQNLQEQITNNTQLVATKVSNDTFNEAVSLINSELNSKQKALTAGEGIEIYNDEISAKPQILNIPSTDLKPMYISLGSRIEIPEDYEIHDGDFLTDELKDLFLNDEVISEYLEQVYDAFLSESNEYSPIRLSVVSEDQIPFNGRYIDSYQINSSESCSLSYLSLGSATPVYWYILTFNFKNFCISIIVDSYLTSEQELDVDTYNRFRSEVIGLCCIAKDLNTSFLRLSEYAGETYLG